MSDETFIDTLRFFDTLFLDTSICELVREPPGDNAVKSIIDDGDLPPFSVWGPPRRVIAGDEFVKSITGAGDVCLSAGGASRSMTRGKELEDDTEAALGGVAGGELVRGCPSGRRPLALMRRPDLCCFEGAALVVGCGKSAHGLRVVQSKRIVSLLGSFEVEATKFPGTSRVDDKTGLPA
jgi:hypothetical protein